MPDDYERQVGARLRGVRQDRDMTLRQVEEASEGRWKAVVVGSYERADRSVSLPKLHELAEFYGVEVAELLPGGRTGSDARPPSLVVDLAALRAASADPLLWPMVRYIADVRGRRGDRGGDRITLRGQDARSLAILLDMTVEGLADLLAQRALLVEEQSQPSPSRNGGRPGAD